MVLWNVLLGLGLGLDGWLLVGIVWRSCCRLLTHAHTDYLIVFGFVRGIVVVRLLGVPIQV